MGTLGLYGMKSDYDEPLINAVSASRPQLIGDLLNLRYRRSRQSIRYQMAIAKLATCQRSQDFATCRWRKSADSRDPATRAGVFKAQQGNELCPPGASVRSHVTDMMRFFSTSTG
jgi:hypothetical protein